MPRLTCIVAFILTGLLATGPANAQSSNHSNADKSEQAQGVRGPGVPAFWVRPGYKVTVAVKPDTLSNARFMTFGDDGTLFVSQRRDGSIAALRDKDGDGVYEMMTPFVQNQRKVHGMQWHDGWLWFTTPTTIAKARDTNGDGKADDVQVILKGLAGKSGHNWRPLLIVGDHLFTAVGDPGNDTDQTKTDREKVWRYNLDGSGKTLWSSGIRNTEELQLRPGTQELWGFDHGSDWFGKSLGEKPGTDQPVTDLNPPDELNHYVQGGFYGHPFITADHLPRYEYLKRPDILDLAAKTIAPQWTDGAHWAPDGWTFISLNNKALPAQQRGDIYVAFHGSWNRVKKAGYRVERVLFDKVTGKPYGGLKVVGTLSGDDNQKVLARPVDVVEAPDGSLLFTSDSPDQMIYRIQWVGTKK